MRKKIKNILFKIKDYDNLFIQNERQKKEMDNQNIYIQHLEVNLWESQKDLSEAKGDIDILKGKINHLELPKYALNELEKKLILADNYTLKLIGDYLDLDNYELVKNIASRVDRKNIAEFIAYRDWALGRNQELKKLILKYIKKEDTYIDRITWEKEQKVNI